VHTRPNSSLDLLDLSNTIIINLLVFVFLLLVFERMRHKKSVYFPRDEWCVHALEFVPVRLFLSHTFNPLLPRTHFAG
jgi:hypothetical protein